MENKGKEIYKHALFKALYDYQLTSEEKNQLQNIIKTHGLAPADLIDIQRQAFQYVMDKVMEDGRITDEERNGLKELITFFNVSPDLLGLDKQRLFKGNFLGMLEKGLPPTVPADQITTPLSTDEKLHYVTGAAVLMSRKATDRKPAVTLKIGKNLPERLNPIHPAPVSPQDYQKIEPGKFWVSSLRIGFEGAAQKPIVEVKKATQIELVDGLLSYRVDPTVAPILIALTEYDVPVALLGYLLKK